MVQRDPDSIPEHFWEVENWKREKTSTSIVSCSISSFNVAFRGQALSFKTYFVLKHPRKQWKITKDGNLNFNYICIICNMYINNFSFTVHKYVRCKRFSREFRTEMMSSEIHFKTWLSRDILSFLFMLEMHSVVKNVM